MVRSGAPTKAPLSGFTAELEVVRCGEAWRTHGSGRVERQHRRRLLGSIYSSVGVGVYPGSIIHHLVAG